MPSFLLACSRDADAYVDAFEARSAARPFLAAANYMAASMIGVLFVWALMDESMLTRVTVGGRPLLLLLTATTTLFAATKSSVSAGDATLAGAHAETVGYDCLMARVARYTGYFPLEWRGRCHTGYVRQQFVALYEPRGWHYARTLVSAVGVPFSLLVIMGRAETILIHLRENTMLHAAVGRVARPPVGWGE